MLRLVDVEMFQRLRDLEIEFNHLADQLGATYAEGEEALAEAEIAEAIQASRNK